MERMVSRMQKHKRVWWGFALGYTVFHGCFNFPFANEMFPFTLQKAYVTAAGYGCIGVLLAGLLGRGRAWLVLALSLAFTLLGLGFRYLLEWGEISNVWNFTPGNIALYLAAAPLLCLTAYWICQARMKE